MPRRGDHLEVVVDLLAGGEGGGHAHRPDGLISVALVDVHRDVKPGVSVHRLVTVVDEQAGRPTETADLRRRGRQAGRVVDKGVSGGSLKEERSEENVGLVGQA